MLPSLHILLVEDNPGDADLIQVILADSVTTRYEFTRADRLASALQVLATTQVDLILLDLNLPDSNGLETVKKMFAAAESLPIVILTGTDDRQLGFEAVKAGAQDYLVKGKIALDVFERIIRYAMERHRNRQQVKASEQFLRTTLDALSSHIAILDHTGRILNVNKAWCDFARQNNANSETTGPGANYFTVCNMVTGEDAATAFAVADGIRAVIDGTRQVFQLEYPCHSPTEQRWFILQATPFPGTFQRQVVVTHENITVRKQAEEALVASEKRIRRVIDTSPNCVFVKDNAGRYVMVNATTAALFKTTCEAMLGKTDGELVAGSWDQNAAESGDALGFQTVDGDLQPTSEKTFVAGDGTIRWFQTFRSPILFAGSAACELTISIDITQQREAREKLRSSELLLQSILDTLTSRIILMDRDQRIVWVNRAAAVDVAKEHAQMIGLYCYDFFHQQNAPCTHCPATQALSEGRLSQQIKKTVQGRTWATYAIPIRNDWGEIVNLVEVADDITDRLAMEGKLQQAQKMESLGALAGGIAHDFNNILTGVLGYADLAKGQAKDPTIIEYLDQIYAAGVRATDLVRQILTFSRRRNTELQPLQVPMIVKEALKLLRSTLPTSIAIKTLIAKEVDPVLADPTQIHQIVMNLCTNASHAMEPDGGTMTVTIDQVTPEPLFFEQHPELTTGSYLRLRIGDTGCGIAPEILSSIFDPYFTTKELGVGTGLGLAVVHGIVKEYGGEILVDSVLEQGSTFTVLLPVTSKVIFDLETVKDDQLLTGTERILLVDDELAITGLYKRFLEFHGYQVTTFNDPRKALDGFKADPMAFDLILSDVAMPGMTGEKMGLQMLALRPDLPIVLMTGFSQHLTEAIAKKQGFHTLMIKPLPKNLLLVKLREIFIFSKKH